MLWFAEADLLPAWLFLISTTALADPSLLDAEDLFVDPDRARTVRITAAVTGAAIGAGIGLATVWDGEIFRDGANPRSARWVSVTGVGMQTLSSTFATWWFADITLKHPRRPWRNVGWGVLYGMAAGAISYGVGFGTLMTLGWATDTISMGEPMNRWYTVIPASFGLGALQGAVLCIPVGGVLAPTISVSMRW